MLVKFSGIDGMVEEELMKLCTYSGRAELNGWSWIRRIFSCEQFVRSSSRYLGSWEDSHLSDSAPKPLAIQQLLFWLRLWMQNSLLQPCHFPNHRWSTIQPVFHDKQSRDCEVFLALAVCSRFLWVGGLLAVISLEPGGLLERTSTYLHSWTGRRVWSEKAWRMSVILLHHELTTSNAFMPAWVSYQNSAALRQRLRFLSDQEKNVEMIHQAATCLSKAIDGVVVRRGDKYCDLKRQLFTTVDLRPRFWWIRQLLDISFLPDHLSRLQGLHKYLAFNSTV